MWWRPTFIRYIFFTCGIATTGTMILLAMMLLPSVVNGPDNVNYLQRSQCTINNITYLENLCTQNPDFEFSNLEYIPHWNNCLLVEFNISNSLGSICSWIYPESFSTQLEAFIAVSQDYPVGTEYDCVVDTIKNICYADKHELIIYIAVVVSLCGLSCLSWGMFMFLTIKYKRRKR